MKKIDKSKYSEYVESARGCTANRVYPMSIASGFQNGDIYTDGRGGVLFWHYCGFAYITGPVCPDFLEEVYKDFLLSDSDRRFLLITDSEYTTEYFSNSDSLQFNKRVEYVHSGTVRKPSIPDSRFMIERITADNIGDIRGRIIPSFSWDSAAAFSEHGFGFIARCERNFAAVAFSSAVSPEEIDIGVETCESYRHNGLASYLAYQMCEEIFKLGRMPVWAHAETNEKSRKTAISNGFVPIKVNSVIRYDRTVTRP